ncbi:hypothetical protein HYC85_029539 [Camellia sinensis]|uniref:Uncharacterized protein n=1 Tax=Camellia sinensis TaxID=4442 RepID=A0A7J7G0Q4_CAMSI|nr:hypothetical protein HYC85_029539 [Camellia sinensis]
MSNLGVRLKPLESLFPGLRFGHKNDLKRSLDERIGVGEGGNPEINKSFCLSILCVVWISMTHTPKNAIKELQLGTKCAPQKTYTVIVKQETMLLLHFLSFYFFPLFLFVLFLFLCFSLITTTPTDHKNLPSPSPPKLPIVGNLHQLGLFPHCSLRSLAQKYGPLMQLHFGSVPVLVVSSAVAAREIMKTHDLAFSSRPKTSIATRLTYNSKDVGFSPYGEYWRQVRSICVLHLLSNRRVQSFRNVREEETALIIEQIKHYSSSSSSSLVNLTDMFVTLTNNIVCRVALGRKYGGTKGGRRFKELLVMVGELLGAFNVGDYIPWLAWMNRINGLDAKVESVFKEVDEFLEGVVEEHVDRRQREGSDSVHIGSESKHDFVDLLLQIQQENTAGPPIHRDTIKALILIYTQAANLYNHHELKTLPSSAQPTYAATAHQKMVEYRPITAAAAKTLNPDHLNKPESG